jgi:RimJ/RimL family protein N-acetyltransferase
MNALIKLRPFEETDIPSLVSWIPDARFLLQFAGLQYKYPLDNAQLLESIEKTRGERPLDFMFAAVRQPGGTVIGHVELLSVDYAQRRARLGRVLIGPAEWRGKGYGRAMTTEALDYGFNSLGLEEISLGVFDFNQPAVSCYEKLGFIQSDFRPNARTFEHEQWNLVIMKLGKQTWLKERHSRGKANPPDAVSPRP